ncbi:Uncharacterized protein SCF082_LOCUS21420 [Durusdinium trenchii]|uniref:Uncharacterized protein n=1 Tax=Durusdinium trenchii TaxID=1381693 RepID=A0ABP0LBT2_9DINO
MAPLISLTHSLFASFEAFQPHEFVAFEPKHLKEVEPEEPEELTEVPDEDDQRFAEQPDPQLERLGAELDRKLNKLEDRLLTGDLQNIVVPIPNSRPPTADSVQIVQGKPSITDPKLGTPSSEIEELLKRVETTQKKLIRGPRSDRLEVLPSSAVQAGLRRPDVLRAFLT